MSRSVLVTGGNRGIGLAIARALVEAGDRVTVTYRATKPPDDLPAVPCDVTDPAEVAAAFDQVTREQGPVEVLVANAGITRDGLLLRMTDEDFEDVLAANLTGAVRVARRAAQDMLAARWGRLIFISSAVALTGSPGQVNYTASKAALIGVARSLAWELGSRGITANVVAPGLVDTDMSRAMSERRRAEYLAMTALRRTGTPAEVAAVVRFLAGAEASYVTGAVVPVAGGLGMGF
ncbi:3-oxoacyl-ACP reductase FabG [Micromonospora lupini]|uniref:3-oxoacyl-(Acyl-carrier-protein) reductase n=1 Tax=Micromonospora lupini str. Lupac 08 TaxID=1150864 RepID=I0KW10_9ACTN|nr:3-oxoacyl-ACP reductase FabG [Micromonospora lupini]CCH15757.1 3-oxoacyl-(acyl-carrier-protein) reductase [Micromonospora lupini str. Lupac 08]